MTSRESVELQGKRALVTGGSRGLGEAVVLRLAAAGATVITSARSAPADPELPAEFFAADLATLDGATRLADHVTAAGGVDILVNNAGGSSPFGPLLSRADEDWQAELAVNLMAAVRLDRLLIPAMVGRGRGVVVHMSSGASRTGTPEAAAYAASKAALNSYSRSLAQEVGPAGVRVVAVLPGYVPTARTLPFQKEMAERFGIPLSEVQQQMQQTFGGLLPQAGEPNDVAELVAFLVSDRAKFLTGSQFRVDGGLIDAV